MGAEVPRAALVEVEAFKVGGCCVLIKVFLCLHGIFAVLICIPHILCNVPLLHFFMFSC